MKRRLERVAERIAQLSPEQRRVLSRRVRSKSASSASLTADLVVLNAAGSRRPFFCVHPSGGDVLCYARLAACLGMDQPFYGFRAKGLDDGEEILESVECMARRYTEQLLCVQRDGAFLLGGYSMGALVAYEMARQLQLAGRTIALLAIIDMWVLSPLEKTNIDDALIVTALVGDSLPVSLEFLRGMPEEEQVPYAWRSAREFGVLGPDVTLPQVQRIVSVCKANDQAAEAYTPGPYAGKVTLFRAKDERDGMRGRRPPARDPFMGWGKVASQVEVHAIIGNHDNLIMSPQVEQLAAELRVCIERASAGDCASFAASESQNQ
jgi:thioesterase domain-containing protein